MNRYVCNTMYHDQEDALRVSAIVKTCQYIGDWVFRISSGDSANDKRNVDVSWLV